MSSCLVVRLGDITLYRVTTAKSRQTPKEFIVGNFSFFLLLSFTQALLRVFSYSICFLPNHSYLCANTAVLWVMIC